MARVLVIEDDQAIRQVLREAMERLEHEVSDAGDGEEGLLRFREAPADLVITDILMPRKEGIQTIMELRRDYPEIKIIAISGGGAVGPEAFLTMARELGADRTLAKPFRLRQLETLVQELLAGLMELPAAADSKPSHRR